MHGIHLARYVLRKACPIEMHGFRLARYVLRKACPIKSMACFGLGLEHLAHANAQQSLFVRLASTISMMANNSTVVSSFVYEVIRCLLRKVKHCFTKEQDCKEEDGQLYLDK